MYKNRYQSNSTGNELILCAGLPFTGARTISLNERRVLKHNLIRHIVVTILWLAAIPLSLILPYLTLTALGIVIDDKSPLLIMLVVWFLSVIFLGTPIAILKARDILKRARIVRRTLSAGEVRSFEGIFDNADWTDNARNKLVRSQLINEDEKEYSLLELYYDFDVVYQVNGVEPEKWMEIEITIAAPAPVSAARFLLPVELQEHVNGDHIERRRLSDAEREELLGYAADIRKQRWYCLILLWLGGGPVNKLISELTDLSPDMSLIISISISLTVCGYLFYKSTKMAINRENDAEYGWALIIEPSELSMSNSTLPVEILPISEIVWMIRGRPAGWRKFNQKTSRKM